jgi:hypothetical protein
MIEVQTSEFDTRWGVLPVVQSVGCLDRQRRAYWWTDFYPLA